VSDVPQGLQPPLIEVRDVFKMYGHDEIEVRALDGVSFPIENGDFVAVMGASGSGKSTCLNVLGALDSPSHGAYLFRGVDVTRLTTDQQSLFRRHFLGFVFQGFNLLARTSALENVELPLVYRRVPPRERRRLALAALADVGLRGGEHHTAVELSGGQQQRVAIARAIVTKPVMLLADEPTGNLDSARKGEIMKLLVEMNATRGITIVMVTHEPDVARFASRTIHFNDGKIARDIRSAV
jgi:putative ABC transport system ATP-binding protein